MLLPEEHLNETVSNLPNVGDGEMDLSLKKHNVTCCSSPVDEDGTVATAFTSMSSLSSYSTRSSLSRSTRRGSILKSPSSSSSSPFKKNDNGPQQKRRASRISFSTTPNQVFTIENKEEYYDDMFYDQESLADFRYEALMWEAGMVDEDGTPISLVQSNEETNNKYEQMDQANGSLDFDDLLLDELNDTSNGCGSLKDDEQDKAYSRQSIKELRRSIDGTDLQWKATSELFCNLEDWDDDFGSDDDESIAGDDELNDDLDKPFTALDATPPTSTAFSTLSAKEKFAQQRKLITFHKNKQKQQEENLNQKFNQKFSSFNLNDDDDDVLVLEASDDGSHQSEDDDDEQSVTLSRHNLSHWEDEEGGAFACEDDSQQSQRSSADPCDDSSDTSQCLEEIVGDTSERSRVRRSLVRRDSLRESLKSLSDVFLGVSSRSLESLDSTTTDGHSADNNNNNIGGEQQQQQQQGGGDDKQGRLMAKMRGLRESLRSIQEADLDFDSDDDSEWGDDDDQVQDGVVNSMDVIKTKNLRRSLIGKHKIYSPVPNQHPKIEHVDSVKDMTIPEL